MTPTRKLGSLLSDLDWMTSEVKTFTGDAMALEDAVFLSKSGIVVEDEAASAQDEGRCIGGARRSPATVPSPRISMNRASG